MSTTPQTFDCPYCSAKQVSGRYYPECRRTPIPSHIAQMNMERAFDAVQGAWEDFSNLQRTDSALETYESCMALTSALTTLRQAIEARSKA